MLQRECLGYYFKPLIMNVKILRAIIKRIECKLSNEWRKKCNTHLRSNIYEEYYKTLLKDIKEVLTKREI